jgi:hypothetical protein
VKKTWTEQDVGLHAAKTIRKDCIDVLMASMRFMLKHHKITEPSAHLLMISLLVEFVQTLDADATAQFLIAMIEKFNCVDDPAGLAAIDVEYAAAHTQLLRAFDLFLARPQDGGRA